jgi:hypothetical protein
MTAAAPITPGALSKPNKIGLVLAFLLGVVDLTPRVEPASDGKHGPPLGVLLLDGILGLITLVAVVVAWRTARRGAVRLTAGARIISVITALPAFFVDVPPLVRVQVGVVALLTVAIVAMMLTPARLPTPVID